MFNIISSWRGRYLIMRKNKPVANIEAIIKRKDARKVKC